MKKVAVASDHAGYLLKGYLAKAIENWGYTVVDCGTNSQDSCDYPDYANILCNKVKNQEVDCGILVCGTGIGMSIVANKHRGIYAALVNDVFSAELSRGHNDSNVLCLGANVIGTGLAVEIARIWLTKESEAGRHTGRRAKIKDLEEK